MTATINGPGLTGSDILQQLEAETTATVAIESCFASALGQMAIDDPPHEVLDMLRHSRQYPNNQQVVAERMRLNTEAKDQLTLSLMVLARQQLGQYTGVVLIPAAAYSPLALGEGPGNGFIHELKAIGHEPWPVIGPRDEATHYQLVPRLRSRTV